MDDAFADGAITVAVTEPDLDTLHDRLLECFEVRWGRRRRVAPTGRIEHDGGCCLLRFGPEGLGEGLNQLPQGGFGLGGDCGRWPGDQKQGAGLCGGEPAQIGSGATDE